MIWKTANISILVFCLSQNCLYGQTSQFDVDSPVCLSENLNLTNNSLGSVSHLWDFCFDGLSNDNSASILTTLSGVSNVEGVSMGFDKGHWFGFVTDRGNNRLLRLSFNNDFSSVTSVFDLGNIDGELSTPKNIELVKEGGLWYGILVNIGSNNIVRISFGPNLDNEMPSATNIGNLDSWSNLRGVDLVQDGANYVVVVSSENSDFLTLVNFGNSITNTPNVPGDILRIVEGVVDRPHGVSLISNNGEWYGLLSSFGMSQVYHLSFGSNLFSEPTTTLLGSVAQPTELSFVRDGTGFYGLVMTRNSGLHRVEFGDTPALSGGEALQFLNSVSLPTNVFSFDLIKDKIQWFGFAISASGQLNRVDFDDVCNDVNLNSSLDFEPANISYNQPGTKAIELISIASDGNFDVQTQTIVVDNISAPDIQFSSSGQCVDSEIAFSSTSVAGGIQTYTWDFGDGTTIGPAPGLASPTHDYSATMGAGTYDVTLTVVSDDGCTNFAQQTIQIFNPPTANFADPPAGVCSGEAFTFTNQSTFDVGSPVSYLWDFNGEGTSTDENPTFTFQFGGPKTITLTTSIPGCSSMVSKPMNIQFGAVPDFTFNDICLGEVASFTDLSNGAGTMITDYNWAFGDGNTSTLQNPTNPYGAIGDYNVSLSVTNDFGCTVTTNQTISVHAIPDANFINGPACEGPIQFTDQTLVEAANITQWLWDFDNGETSTERNPVATFNQATEFDISLIATSNFGCSDEATQTVSIQSAPTPEFSLVQGCLGETTQFRDETFIASINPATGYFWQIGDEVYTEANPEHLFDGTGTFTASMTISVANGCAVTATRTIEVPALPIPEFTFTNSCINTATIFEDQTSDAGDPIVSWAWDFDGLSSANGETAQFIFPQPGNYNVGLTTTSTLGCTAFIGKTITVNDQPTSGFESSSTFGPPPLSVNFTNQSSSANAFAWILDGAAAPFSLEEHAALLFEEEGDYEVSLVAFNEFGCTDTLSQVIEVVFPAVDLVLDEVIAIPNNDRTNIVIRGANRGTVTLESFDIIINVEDEITLAETFDQPLLKDQPFVHTLDFDLLQEVNDVEFLCIELVLPETEEPNRDNNQGCLSFEEEIIIQEPFPNPTSESLRVNVILPEVKDGLHITLMNVYGEIIEDEIFEDPLEGLNVFDFAISHLTSGLYLVRIQYDGVEEVRRIRKE